jgi:hypothetical protein
VTRVISSACTAFIHTQESFQMKTSLAIALILSAAGTALAQTAPAPAAPATAAPQANKATTPAAAKGFDPQPEPPKVKPGALPQQAAPKPMTPGAVRGFDPQPDPPKVKPGVTAPAPTATPATPQAPAAPSANK